MATRQEKIFHHPAHLRSCLIQSSLPRLIIFRYFLICWKFVLCRTSVQCTADLTWPILSLIWSYNIRTCTMPYSIIIVIIIITFIIQFICIYVLLYIPFIITILIFIIKFWHTCLCFLLTWYFYIRSLNLCAFTLRIGVKGLDYTPLSWQARSFLGWHSKNCAD